MFAAHTEPNLEELIAKQEPMDVWSGDSSPPYDPYPEDTSDKTASPPYEPYPEDSITKEEPMYDWLCKPSSPPPEFFNAPSPSEERELSGVEAARHRFDKLVREVKDAPVQRRNSECSTLESQDQKPSKRIYRSRRKADMGEIFELRGKPTVFYPKYEPLKDLCRAWICGKNDFFEWDEPHEETSEATPPDGDLLDIVVKEVYAMPHRPRSAPLEPESIPPPPARIPYDVDVEDAAALLQGHLKHWRNVKREWCTYMRRHSRGDPQSVQLLELMHKLSDEDVI